MRRDFKGWLEGGHSRRMRDDGRLHLGDARRDIKKQKSWEETLFPPNFELHNSNLLI